MFDMVCRPVNDDNVKGECGINDECRKEEWCFPSNSSKGHECGYKSINDVMLHFAFLQQGKTAVYWFFCTFSW
jgi:hypothetical protein